MNDKAKAAAPRRFISVAVAAVASICWAGLAWAKPEIHVSPDPSRTTAVHNIPLFDADNNQIDPAAKDAAPISMKVTCGKCHDYDIIKQGWHFNTGDANVPPGRPGEPWVLADRATGTQIPISPRGWKGTYKPAQIGMSTWTYVDKFGRQMPGGDYGEEFAAFDNPATDHWNATGYLPINCLACHSRDHRENESEWAACVMKGNYVEAATAASGIGEAIGWVNKLTGYDREMGSLGPENPQFLPSVVYDKSLFGYKNKVFVDVSAFTLPNNRCYYCHTAYRPDKKEYETREDIHMARGIRCVMCHRNGINHQISRDYEGEKTATPGYTCRACHLGESKAMTEALKKGGFPAAPRPAHRGIPQLHFDKLTCTACHSGPWPKSRPTRVQTSRIHGLGDHEIPYNPNSLPTVLEPVFVKQADGKIAPCRVVFPAFFGRMTKDGKVTPMLPSAVEATAGKVFPPRTVAWPASVATAARDTLEKATGEVTAEMLAETFWNSGLAPTTESVSAALKALPPEPTTQKTKPTTQEVKAAERAAAIRKLATDPATVEQVVARMKALKITDLRQKVAAALKALASANDPNQPVYVGGGKLWKLAGGKLAASDSPAARPYAWPIAHNVRPASQSLGADGACTDCHSTKSPFFFGKVSPVTPVALGDQPAVRMARYEGEDPAFHKVFAATFVFRPYLKIFGFGVSGIVILILLGFGLGGLTVRLKRFARRRAS